MQSMDWPPAHSAALREYFAKGMSYSAIAGALNAKFGTSYTRNAALGRATRMGLAGPGPSGEQGKPAPETGALGFLEIDSRKTRQRRVSEFWLIPPVFKATEVEKLRTADIVPRNLSLIDLEDGDCRYPYGGNTDGETITFCGHPQRPGSSYCPAHFDLIVGPGSASERAADFDLLKAAGTVSDADQLDDSAIFHFFDHSLSWD
jgi:GcrA cell cycle regulator